MAPLPPRQSTACIAYAVLRGEPLLSARDALGGAGKCLQKELTLHRFLNQGIDV